MKILIVDDEHLIKQGIRTVIQRTNAKWIVTGEANDGLEALEEVEKEKPDVIITDIRMPEIDGIELTKRVKQRFPEILIIIISGYAEFKFAQEAVRQGAIDYLLKPTKPEELVGVLTKAQKIIQERGERFKLEENLRLEIETLRKEMALNPAVNIENLKEPTCQNEQQYRKVIEVAVRYIEQNYARDLTLKHLSEVIYMNTSYFCDLFKQQTGQGFSEYLTKIRVEKAKEILVSRIELKSYEVAELVGYNDPKYFTQIFKKLVGVTPTEYRDGIASNI